MKVYGTVLCPDCMNYKEVQKLRGFDAEFVDITASTANLKEFLKIRDNEKIYNDVKKNGGIGIPLFVNDNGQMSFDMNEALSWIGQPAVEEAEFEKINSCGTEGC